MLQPFLSFHKSNQVPHKLVFTRKGTNVTEADRPKLMSYKMSKPTLLLFVYFVLVLLKLKAEE